VGVAAARMAREETIASLENIVSDVEVAELRILRCSTEGYREGVLGYLYVFRVRPRLVRE
jgi:hypothetical protein